MELFEIIVTAVVTSGFVTAIVNWYLKYRETHEERRWELKREACLEALQIIDSRFAEYGWRDSEGNILKVDRQTPVSTEDVRSCFNKLILACSKPNVPEEFEKCLNLKLGAVSAGKLDMNSVVTFRNAVRKELGFGCQLNTKVSWIMYLNREADDSDT